MPVFEQGHILFARTIFARQCKLLVKENLIYFPFMLPRKTCQGKMCQRELGSVYSPEREVFLVKENLLDSVNEA